MDGKKQRLLNFTEGKSYSNGGLNMTDVVDIAKQLGIKDNISSLSRDNLEKFVKSNPIFKKYIETDTRIPIPASVPVPKPMPASIPKPMPIHIPASASMSDKSDIEKIISLEVIKDGDYENNLSNVLDVCNIIHLKIKRERGLYEKKYGQKPETTELLAVALCKWLKTNVNDIIKVPIYQYAISKITEILGYKIKLDSYRTYLLKTIDLLKKLTPPDCYFGAGGGRQLFDDLDVSLGTIELQTNLLIKNVQEEKAAELSILLGSLKVQTHEPKKVMNKKAIGLLDK